ncbi:MAG: GDSL family lipase [Clostridia bacterium]|nr:GDSL family lipase [Clostridia bacterium]
MKITKLLADKNNALRTNKIPTIAFLGDSVTQGCFEIYEIGEGIETIFERKHAYSEYVSRILGMLYPRCQVNIINAGISGDSAPGGLARIDRDVLCHAPDLTVVCFGLNDSGRGMDGIKAYSEALDGIFEKLLAAGSEVIFMTPNMMCTEDSPHNTIPAFKKIAEGTMRTQNGGVLEAYLNEAKAVAEKRGVRVCDVFAKWKLMDENGVHITDLLSNYINHPTREMNWLFAYSLVEEMMK